jgi:hypothetical protein
MTPDNEMESKQEEQSWTNLRFYPVIPVEGRRKPGKLVSLGPDSNSEHFE